MRISRLPADAKAGDIRILNEIPASVEEEVRSTLRAVRDGGDAAVAEINARFDP
ncbi:MAG: hypothetical protein QOG62_122, partial [Thermoleophilaceae bacterium]|nr:hypothetical protein [Thermoleophilaceae bacterium]